MKARCFDAGGCVSHLYPLISFALRPSLYPSFIGNLKHVMVLREKQWSVRFSRGASGRPFSKRPTESPGMWSTCLNWLDLAWSCLRPRESPASPGSSSLCCITALRGGISSTMNRVSSRSKTSKSDMSRFSPLPLRHLLRCTFPPITENDG